MCLNVRGLTSTVVLLQDPVRNAHLCSWRPVSSHTCGPTSLPGYCTFRDRAIGGLPAVIDSSFRTDLLDCARVVGSLETNQKRGSGRLARQRTWRHSAVYAITRRSRWHSPQSFRSNFGPIERFFDEDCFRAWVSTFRPKSALNPLAAKCTPVAWPPSKDEGPLPVHRLRFSGSRALPNPKPSQRS